MSLPDELLEEFEYYGVPPPVIKAAKERFQNRLAIASADGCVSIWDPNTGELLSGGSPSFKRRPVWALVRNGPDELAFIRDGSKSVYLLNSSDARAKGRLTGHNHSMQVTKLSSYGSVVVSVSGFDSRGFVTVTAAGTPTRKIGGNFRCTRMISVLSSSSAVSADDDDSFRLLNLDDSGGLVPKSASVRRVDALCRLGPASFASSHERSGVTLWDCQEAFECSATLSTPPGTTVHFLSAAVDSSAMLAAAGSSSDRWYCDCLCLYDPRASCEPINQLSGKAAITSIDFNGSLLASGVADGSFNIWDLRKIETSYPVTTQRSCVMQVLFI
eukprot:gnl/Hemi2/384_TR119_c0_g1_i1.p1 gnl/Hemi2/384_TR119_c0_g1~~gnl/Hemi2/384_TR119_c0_g1_i1.p1  ORF type:complete len:343 (-),score=-14.11 gnl/Hemi2/384_TR119_c0_g1_i1:82-1068(-)